MKIIIFPRYDYTQAATRVRVQQYIPFLEAAGVNFEVFPVLMSDGISGRSSIVRFILERIKSYFRVTKKLISEKEKTSIIHIHSELFPFIPFFIEFRVLSFLGKEKFIIELDDAWFHRYDNSRNKIVKAFLGKKIDLMMKHSILVIAGNQYIADRAKSAGALHIEIIPSVVDMKRYSLPNMIKEKKYANSDNHEKIAGGEPFIENGIPVIGWIGTPATTKFLNLISGVIRFIVENRIAKFVAIGADPTQLDGLPVEILKWNEEIEVEELSKFDIGIMPLSDTLFERGKCGYKLIQYMACKLPVVASPVGVNSQIVIQNETGFLASTDDEWIKYLSLLCKDADFRKKIGFNGFVRANSIYSLNFTASKYTDLLKKIAFE